jgi:hypothetical protein
MNIIEMIARSHNGQGLDVLGQQFGLSREQTLAAVAELAPMVTSGVRRNTREPDGMVSLFEALSGGGHERYLEDDTAVQYDTAKDDGNAILGHLFGRKEVSREVAMQAAGTTGIGGAILKKMLPVIASMVMGAIFKRITGGAPAPAPRGGSGGGQGGGLGDIISDILGGGQKQQPRGGQGGGGLGDILGDILGGGSGQQRSPAPQPQQRRPAPGGGLDDLLRDILGGGMGGGSTGRSSRRQRPSSYNDDAIGRGRNTLDDILGGDTRTGSGNAADDLLESVNRRLGY